MRNHKFAVIVNWGNSDNPKPKPTFVHANGLPGLVGMRLCRARDWFHFPDVAMG